MLEISAVADWMLGVQMSSFFLSLIGMCQIPTLPNPRNSLVLSITEYGKATIGFSTPYYVFLPSGFF
jgi:hypothetical protein